jgi:hypothetical protein
MRKNNRFFALKALRSLREISRAGVGEDLFFGVVAASHQRAGFNVA